MNVSTPYYQRFEMYSTFLGLGYKIKGPLDKRVEVRGQKTNKLEIACKINISVNCIKLKKALVVTQMPQSGLLTVLPRSPVQNPSEKK